jgi:hypothetical protein
VQSPAHYTVNAVASAGETQTVPVFFFSGLPCEAAPALHIMVSTPHRQIHCFQVCAHSTGSCPGWKSTVLSRPMLPAAHRHRHADGGRPLQVAGRSRQRLRAFGGCERPVHAAAASAGARGPTPGRAPRAPAGGGGESGWPVQQPHGSQWPRAAAAHQVGTPDGAAAAQKGAPQSEPGPSLAKDVSVPWRKFSVPGGMLLKPI